MDFGKRSRMYDFPETSILETTSHISQLQSWVKERIKKKIEKNKLYICNWEKRCRVTCLHAADYWKCPCHSGLTGSCHAIKVFSLYNRATAAQNRNCLLTVLPYIFTTSIPRLVCVNIYPLYNTNLSIIQLFYCRLFILLTKDNFWW